MTIKPSFTSLIISLMAGPALAADLSNFCMEAQQIIVRTEVPVDLVIHEDFNAFVKSKAIIDGPDGKPEIQQYNWLDEDGNALGVSCKLKNTDHLTMTYGAGSAGPDQPCQEMNRRTLAAVSEELGLQAFSVYKAVVFDPDETPGNPENPGMTGPEWLKPFIMADARYHQGTPELRIKTKGFIVEFSDPRYQKAPARFRGVHYCHFIAPQHLKALLLDQAFPPTSIGRDPTADDIAGNTGPGAE